jgi:phospholipid/cholesterol/gamma-HCH transport system ATP-binding protein
MKVTREHTINRNNAVIYIKDLYKSFGHLHVLRGINLTVYEGENVAVLGKSGTGKSVLIKIIAGLLEPDSGEVMVLDKDVHKLDQKELDELRLNIGFCFQHSALYDSMSVKQNLMFPLTMNRKGISKKDAEAAVIEVLDAVGLKNKINHMPSDLSGGQRKRIGIARTLILKPKIMLYDEPTAGLDPITSAEINSLINEVQREYNTSSIIITHDLTCARSTGNRIAMLLDGVFVRTGTFDEVFTTDDQRVRSFFDYNFIENT